MQELIKVQKTNINGAKINLANNEEIHNALNDIQRYNHIKDKKIISQFIMEKYYEFSIK